METNFNSKLFKKKINLSKLRSVVGGDTNSTESVCTGSSCSYDVKVTTLDEDCNPISTETLLM